MARVAVLTFPMKGKNSDGEDYEEDVTAIDAELIRQACAVYLYIKAHREELSKYNPSNGWGSYDKLLECSGEFVKVLLDIPAEEYEIISSIVGRRAVATSSLFTRIARIYENRTHRR